nr:hypothetical protein [Tessaracoccus defluvii]
MAIDLVYLLLIALADAHGAPWLGRSVDTVAGGDYPVGINCGSGAHSVIRVGIIDTHGDDRLGLLGLLREGCALQCSSRRGAERSCCDHSGDDANYEFFHFFPFQRPR